MWEEGGEVALERRRPGVEEAVEVGVLHRGTWAGVTQVGLTFRVQQARQPQVLLGRAEGPLQVVVGVGLGEFAEVHKVRPGQGHRAGRQRGLQGRWASNEEHPHLTHPGRGAGGTPARGELCVLGGTVPHFLCVSGLRVCVCVCALGTGHV